MNINPFRLHDNFLKKTEPKSGRTFDMLYEALQQVGKKRRVFIYGRCYSHVEILCQEFLEIVKSLERYTITTTTERYSFFIDGTIFTFDCSCNVKLSTDLIAVFVDHSCSLR